MDCKNTIFNYWKTTCCPTGSENALETMTFTSSLL